MRKKLHLVSLGCTKNLVDSEVMLGKLKDYELSDNASEADVIILNTCGFIDSAKEESLSTLFELHETRKEGSVLVCAGCLSERYKEDMKKEIPEVDIFTGVGDYAKIDELLKTKQDRFSEHAFLIENEERVVTGSNLHAYIKLSEGCNQRCSFCAIPLFKGRLQSRSPEAILAEIENLRKQGYQEFTLISQDSSSYLRDKGEKEGLINLIKAIGKLDITSAKVLYLYPSTTTIKLIETIAKAEKFENYFDMPLQHISEKMLKKMKRGANQSKHLKLLEKMKDVKDSFIRTAFIAGHPGESEADFEELKAFIKDFGFDRVNVFPYSDEEDTASFTMKHKLNHKTIQKRARELEKTAAKTNAASLKKMVDKSFHGIIEGTSTEHELLLKARPFIFAPEIDGEILVNEIEGNGQADTSKIYTFHIQEIAGDKLIAKATPL